MTRITPKLLTALFVLGCGSGAVASPSHGQWTDSPGSSQSQSQPQNQDPQNQNQSQNPYQSASDDPSQGAQAQGQGPSQDTSSQSQSWQGQPSQGPSMQGQPSQGPSMQGQPSQGPSSQGPSSQTPSSQGQTWQDPSSSSQSQDQDNDDQDEDIAATVTAGQPRLGILVMAVTPELRRYFGVTSDRGVLVARIEPGSPAARAGLQVGDILTRVGRQPVHGGTDVIQALGAQPGGRVRLSAVRHGRMVRLVAMLPGSASSSSQPSQDQM
jgi:membrane-associated protease RseP (regulator of RpoE activity)